jgi:UDP-GlcNAc:undecaprenyl-phosphate/decaprenyl-phosphate GlcNAc-1-phosphate transferase
VRSAFVALVIALVAVAILTPLVRLVALRLGAVSVPGGRHVHQTAIPRLGGLAICGGFLIAVTAIYLFSQGMSLAFDQIRLRMVGLLVGGAAMCAVGVIDDTRGIRARYKLLFQIAVSVFAFACGLRIMVVHLPFVGDIHMWALALPLTVLWIVGVVNAVNLIDGLDGLAAGVVFFAATTNFVVAWLNAAPLVAVLAGAIAGSVLGFLIYNWNPARIFMGDSGSYFLGYVLATTALVNTSQKGATAISLLVPIMALGVPIFDTLFAMVRRILERRPVFSPDRGHIHHRLLDMGLTHRRAVVIIYAVCGVFTVAAIGVSLERTWQVGAALLGASAALVGLVRFVGYFEYVHLRIRQKARIRSRDAEMLRYAVPKIAQRFGAARTEDELMDALFAFAAECELGYVHLLDTRDGGERTAKRWNGPDSDARNLVSALYPIGHDGIARASVRYGWRSDFDDVSPQSEILLQVVTDVLAENLARLRSTLAPAVVSEEDSEPGATLAVSMTARHSRY